jgi:hypothetical protein
MEQWEFIEDSAQELGVSAEALRKWRVRGVPHPMRLAIVERAQETGFAFEKAAFDEPPGSKRAARQHEDAAALAEPASAA